MCTGKDRLLVGTHLCSPSLFSFPSLSPSKMLHKHAQSQVSLSFAAACLNKLNSVDLVSCFKSLASVCNAACLRGGGRQLFHRAGWSEIEKCIWSSWQQFFLLSNLFLIMHYQNMFFQYPVIRAQPLVEFFSSVRTKGKWEPWKSGIMKSKLLVGSCLPGGGGNCLHLLCSQSFSSWCCLDESWLWIASNMSNFCLWITTSPNQPVREKHHDQCQLTVRRVTARPDSEESACSGKEMAAFSPVLAMHLSC